MYEKDIFYSTNKKCTCIDNYYPSDGRCDLGFVTICSRTTPCSNPIFDCINNMCQCKANYMLRNLRCLSMNLGSFCYTNADCDAIDFAKCSNNQKCICRNNYKEKNGNCIPFLGEPCSMNKDCLPLNSLCIDYKCSCDDNFSKKLNNSCFPTKLEFSCDKDEYCFLIPNAKCSFWQCVCKKGYTRQNATCAPLLGSSCSSNEVCAVANSVCIDDICQCDVNYVEQSDNYCMLVTLRKTCKNNNICPAFSNCSAKKLCECELNYGAKNDSVCAPLLNQSCSTLCIADHSICLDGICECEINYVAHSGTICKLGP
ncbi:prion-like-(Q/N-rich) domain-bearing protein 25 [Cotesia glomerata]|uniref:prion-like-(Q/N-rich) domain-bearing protein 25 n=1 Tax=Cotesia glomerata TaxID=32391 RepID=UPI001D022E36|nr:prion-like-(Q/N-rich) domain-bearing protein 25 [Cotesia glomerata]